MLFPVDLALVYRARIYPLNFEVIGNYYDILEHVNNMGYKNEDFHHAFTNNQLAWKSELQYHSFTHRDMSIYAYCTWQAIQEYENHSYQFVINYLCELFGVKREAHFSTTLFQKMERVSKDPFLFDIWIANQPKAKKIERKFR